VKDLATTLEKNSTLRLLDLSWCMHVGEEALAALVQSLSRNYTMMKIILTGCQCLTAPSKLGTPGYLNSPNANAKGSPGVRQSNQVSPVAELMAILQRNNRRPKTLADSANLKIRSPGGHSTKLKEQDDTTLRDTTRHSLRAAIINGAAMYNAEDAEGCLRLFLSTAESVLASNMPAPQIHRAISRTNGQAGGHPMSLQARIWQLRSSFDLLLDELDKQDRGIISSTDVEL